MTTVNGIRKKILFGFVILACLLLLSGLISYMEISQFGNETRRSMESNFKNVEVATLMLDALAEQNGAVLKTVYGSPEGAYNTITSERAEFRRYLGELGFEMAANRSVKSIDSAEIRYNATVDTLFANINAHKNSYAAINDSVITDTGYRIWLETVYKKDYDTLRAAVKSVIIRSSGETEAEAVRLREQAYRAGMPGVITLVVSIFIIVVFYLLINLYYIDPVLKITKSLGNYLDLKTPFNVKVEGRDEVYRLREYIIELITIIRKREQ